MSKKEIRAPLKNVFNLVLYNEIFLSLRFKFFYNLNNKFVFYITMKGKKQGPQGPKKL